MKYGKQPHILNASSNLLGICFVLITALKISKVSVVTLADEICMISAFGFLVGCLFSYASLRTEKHEIRYESVADYAFVIGLILLCIAMLVLAIDVV